MVDVEKKFTVNHINQLRQFIYKQTQNVDDTNDILQDVYIKIDRNIGSLKNTEKFYPWMVKIAKNAVMDHFRSERKFERAINIEEVAANDLAFSEDLNEKVSKCLTSFINNLPSHYKEALILSEIKGKSQKEIASLTGISLSGAKSRVQRGREKLKQLLLDCCYWEIDGYGNILDYANKTTCCKPC